MEAEVEEVVGPKGRHDPERRAKRHGHEFLLRGRGCSGGTEDALPCGSTRVSTVLSAGGSGLRLAPQASTLIRMPDRSSAGIPSGREGRSGQTRPPAAPARDRVVQVRLARPRRLALGLLDRGRLLVGALEAGPTSAPLCPAQRAFATARGEPSAARCAGCSGRRPDRRLLALRRPKRRGRRPRADRGSCGRRRARRPRPRRAGTGSCFEALAYL